MITAVAFAVGFVLLVVIPAAFIAKSSESEPRSLTQQRLYGKYRVQYPDGQISQPFDKSTADSYAEMFDGKVVTREGAAHGDE